jgi:hypothetical protein
VGGEIWIAKRTGGLAELALVVASWFVCDATCLPALARRKILAVTTDCAWAAFLGGRIFRSSAPVPCGAASSARWRGQSVCGRISAWAAGPDGTQAGAGGWVVRDPPACSVNFWGGVKLVKRRIEMLDWAERTGWPRIYEPQSISTHTMQALLHTAPAAQTERRIKSAAHVGCEHGGGAGENPSLVQRSFSCSL